MRAPANLRGLARFFLLTLQLNFRSPGPVIYGFLMPVLFLLAFGSVFRGETPVLYHEMGQLLTISILGGACFGLPTALVADRERGVWKRYRLLPVGTGWLLASTLLVRVVLLSAAALLQIGLAAALYGTPGPANLTLFLGGFLLTATAFMGLGLLVAALADSVPAVQGLGQCLFLPMVMLGGVGVPLAVLPEWCQTVAAFMPGRYAIELLHAGYTDKLGLQAVGFAALALSLIGLASGVAGGWLFRWEAGQRLTRAGRRGVTLALASWLVVGGTAAWSDRIQPAYLSGAGFESLSPALIAQIRYDDLPEDHGLVTRLAPPFPHDELPPRVAAFAALLQSWRPAHSENAVHNIRHLLSVAAVADVGQDLREAEIGRVVFRQLQREYDADTLIRALAWIIFSPDEGPVITQAPELALPRPIAEKVVRERNTLYAKKYLGRLLGQIPD